MKGCKGIAPAKINLFLHINGKRSDGYHNISTLFIPINLYDEIILEKSDKTELLCNDTSVPTDENNIILKTDAILREEFGLKEEFRITLIKNIPSGAGLGGGSSDAALYMKMADKAAGLRLAYEDMFNIMSRIGSDTVFFIKAEASLASGRGEIIRKAPRLPPLFFIIVNPNIHISTEKIYRDKHLLLTRVDLLPNLKESLNFEDVLDIMKNDLEGPVFAKYPQVRKLREDIGGLSSCGALMSGSGSTVFAVYEDISLRDKGFDLLKGKYKNHFIRKAEMIKSF